MLAICLGFLWLAGPACAGQPERAPATRGQPKTPGRTVAAPWPEADALFRQDPRWLGGDAAVSVELGGERVLWLFGDSFVATHEPRLRATARFIRNSVGVQHGTDPSRARMRFFHGEAPDGSPASFFPEQDEAWLWPGHGLYRDGVLTLFMMRVRAEQPAQDGLGFRVVGWTALRVPNADTEPDAWQAIALRTPDTGELTIVGAQVLLEGEHVYAYAVREPGDQAIMLLRWSLADFTRGDLMHPSYFGGQERGFARKGPPAVVLQDGATEFSVSRAPHGGYVQVQSRGFGPAPITLRFAPELTGPFGPPIVAHVPEEARRPGVLIYAARAHPELEGADLVVTYATNTLDPKLLLGDLDIYFPRFVRIDLR